MSSPAPGPADAASPPRRSLPTIGGPYFALAVLFGMNLLNYIDRYSFFAVGVQIKEAFQIDDFWYSILGVAFMVVYTVVSPLMGWLGDRYDRRRLLAGGVALWSFATVGSAFSFDFHHMFFWRSLLGVGEASYGVIAPTLIADLFPVEKRGRAMGVYYLALPLGGALGYALGGWIGDHWGWSRAFLVVGLPGLLFAVAGLLIHDPGRGASEGVRHAGKADRPKMGDYVKLFGIPTYVLNTIGMAAVTFATGAYAVHGANFFQTVRGMSMTKATTSIGILSALAGLLGIALGSGLADYTTRFTRRAYLLLAAVVTAGAVPLGLLAILEKDVAISLGFLFGAMLLLSMVLGPCNTVIANVVPANKRASGYALYIFLIHVFGDISSPVILGWISTQFGRPEVEASWLGRFFSSLGATPVGDENLTVAMLVVAPVLAIGAFFFLLGSRYLPEDQQRVSDAATAGAKNTLTVSYH
ncbi:spinster family MFS transporter [Paludisphaera mucosa]|uniref:MFS transporter n=1 Tax=Paludisphaera mucosa TaxID=3030827 RepID=A0ABT6FH18_9BACT|nr:MFS transporter [Paludisphaera mucosa]MDG3006688.1 MFS transporter [Paludisphaera mucosa]